MCNTQGDYYEKKIELLTIEKEKAERDFKDENKFRTRLWLDLENQRADIDRLYAENATLRLRLAAYMGVTKT